MRNAIPSAVYVLESDNGLVKVGRSRNPAQRARALAAVNGNVITVFHATSERDDASFIEAAAHKLLDGKRRVGEWFDVTAADAVAAILEATRIISLKKEAIRCRHCSPAPLLRGPLRTRLRGVRLRRRVPMRTFTLRVNEEFLDAVAELQVAYTVNGNMPSKTAVIHRVVYEQRALLAAERSARR